ncbi:MAG TPA: hypothetical protein VGP68_03575 [Gemmataceae bacterium]|nr:hypothetical protein [Gemmataceae bacterium]
MTHDLPTHRYSRRQFLEIASVATLAASAPLAQTADHPLKVAAVFTELTYRSHAHVLLENFLEPYYFNGKVTSSGCKVVSFYADQLPAQRDMARQVAEAYKIPIYPTIDQALCLGGKQLAVDAVLSIGEHGTYPTNKLGQHEYPRKRFFDEIVKVFKRSGRGVPVFNDKHLSYRWDWAKEMVDTARKLDFPLMAGSSVPFAQRVPPLEIPAGTRIVEAVATHGGGLDSYDFHGLAVLQSMIDSRAGGETGVAQVQYVSGTALWKAAERGLWSPSLLQKALEAEPNHPADGFDKWRQSGDKAWGFMIQYRDGLRGALLNASGGATHWHFACRTAEQSKPLATSFYVGPWNNRNLFKALAHAIQVHFHQRKSPIPIERTLLVTGLVEAGVESHARGDQPYETPHLNIAYQAQDNRDLREMGATWKIIREGMEEPKGIDKTGGG